jgi:hypothetical protein
LAPSFCVIFGKQLNDWRTLADYNLSKESTIYIVPRTPLQLSAPLAPILLSEAVRPIDTGNVANGSGSTNATSIESISNSMRRTHVEIRWSAHGFTPASFTGTAHNIIPNAHGQSSHILEYIGNDIDAPSTSSHQQRRLCHVCHHRGVQWLCHQHHDSSGTSTGSCNYGICGAYECRGSVAPMLIDDNSTWQSTAMCRLHPQHTFTNQPRTHYGISTAVAAGRQMNILCVSCQIAKPSWYCKGCDDIRYFFCLLLTTDAITIFS